MPMQGRRPCQGRGQANRFEAGCRAAACGAPACQPAASHTGCLPRSEIEAGTVNSLSSMTMHSAVFRRHLARRGGRRSTRYGRAREPLAREAVRDISYPHDTRWIAQLERRRGRCEATLTASTPSRHPPRRGRGWPHRCRRSACLDGRVSAAASTWSETFRRGSGRADPCSGHAGFLAQVPFRCPPERIRNRNRPTAGCAGSRR